MFLEDGRWAGDNAYGEPAGTVFLQQERRAEDAHFQGQCEKP